MRTPFGRRALLQGAAATFALPWLESLGNKAWAAGVPPKRLVVVFTPLGTIQDSWDLPAGPITTLPTIMQPLLPHKADMLVLKGINLAATLGPGPGGAHQRGIGNILTGEALQVGTFGGGNGAPPSGFANGPSLDQYLAAQLRPTTALSTLALGVQNDAVQLPNIARMCFQSAGVPIAAIEDPAYAFNYIFGNVSTGGGPSPALIQEKSILDGVIAEFAAVNPKLSAADRAKLDNHLTQVRDIETRIGNIGNGGACTVPAAPSAIDLTKNDNYPAIGDAQTRLLVQALKCDLTRFATLQWSRGGSATVHNWLSPGGVRINDNHHNLSHNAQTSTQAHDWMVAIDTWYAQKVADLLAQMKAVPEGTGNMLDHSVVLWCSELSNGDTHQRLNMPLVLFGKCGGAIRPGRTVAYTAAPNNKLLTSLANAMGLPITSYGDARYPGALTGLS